MDDKAYIKLSRKMLDWEWYTDINTKVLFLHMLLKANWKDSKFQGNDVPRGSFVSSLPKLSEDTQLTIREIRTAILHLKTTGEVTVKTFSKYSIFTVVKYNEYQSNDMQIDSQPTGKRHSNDILTTIIEEKKERKKGIKEKKEGTKVPEKKDPVIYYPNDHELDKAFADFVEMRKQIKKPMTDMAVERAISKLGKLASDPITGVMDNDLAIQIINRSILNNWQDLYPVKDRKETGKQHGAIDWSSV